MRILSTGQKKRKKEKKSPQGFVLDPPPPLIICWHSRGWETRSKEILHYCQQRIGAVTTRHVNNITGVTELNTEAQYLSLNLFLLKFEVVIIGLTYSTFLNTPLRQTQTP